MVAEQVWNQSLESQKLVQGHTADEENLHDSQMLLCTLCSKISFVLFLPEKFLLNCKTPFP